MLIIFYASYLYIYHWNSTSNESSAGHIRSFVRLPNVSSQRYSFSCAELKNCCIVLCSMFKTIFPSAFCQGDRRIAGLLSHWIWTEAHMYVERSINKLSPSYQWETCGKSRNGKSLRTKSRMTVVNRFCVRFTRERSLASWTILCHTTTNSGYRRLQARKLAMIYS